MLVNPKLKCPLYTRMNRGRDSTDNHRGLSLHEEDEEPLIKRDSGMQGEASCSETCGLS